MFKVGQQVETIIKAPHPAAFKGEIIAIGEENGRILIRDAQGIERVYTPRSLKS